MSKKVIYTEVDEDITSIFDRIKRIPNKEIMLVVPKKAVLLQSLTNLRILNKKADELQKNLTIITHDRSGEQLIKKAGMKVSNQIDIEGPSASKKKIVLKNMSFQPVKALTNNVAEEDPQRMVGKKIKLKDIIHDFKRHKKSEKQSDKLTSNIWSQIASLKRGNRRAVFLVCFLSLAVFLVVLFVALPGATIYIKPKSEILEQPVNLVLAEFQSNQAELAARPPNMIPYFTVSSEFEKNIFYPTLNQEFTGENAVGKIVVVNSTDQEWALKEKTQFQTEDGVVFRSKASIKIPPKQNDLNGETEVEVEADSFDAYGNIVGDRGNIEAQTRLSIRKLTPEQQTIIWGENREPLQGGITKFKKIVTQTDIDTAKKKVELELLSSAKEYIQNYIDERNAINNSRRILLDSDDFLEKEILEIKYSEDIVGKELEKFEIYAKMRIKGIVFDNDQFHSLLRSELVTRLHPDMRLNESSLNDGSIQYTVIDKNEQKQQITISAIIQGVQEYVIEPTSESGIRFSNKVKAEVVGADKDEATAFISNLTEVADVEISIWSIWSNTLPSLPENITIEYKEG